MTEESLLTGGCLCRQIRYRLSGRPRLVSHCHCSMCRRWSGAPFVTWLTARQELFSLELGMLRRYPSSDHGWRAFCADCGTQIASGSSHYPRYIELTLGTLDNPGAVRPERHVYWPDRLPWVEGHDGLPRHTHGANSPVIPAKEGDT
jgi:hypothetical protein